VRKLGQRDVAVGGTMQRAGRIVEQARGPGQPADRDLVPAPERVAQLVELLACLVERRHLHGEGAGVPIRRLPRPRDRRVKRREQVTPGVLTLQLMGARLELRRRMAVGARCERSVEVELTQPHSRPKSR
jgi:hypothetical protein